MRVRRCLGRLSGSWTPIAGTSTTASGGNGFASGNHKGLASTASSYTDWDLHLFGLWLGARTLPSSPIAGLKSLALPVEYIRCVETRYVLQHLDVRPGQRVLDIGSPTPPSLF